MARQHEQEHTEVVRGATGRPVVRGTHGCGQRPLPDIDGRHAHALSGGNAFDAAVAMGFAAAVLEPTASYSSRPRVWGCSTMLPAGRCRP